MEPGWEIVSVAASRGWVLLKHSEEPPIWVCKYSIVDRSSHCPLKGWPTRKLPCGFATMAVGAEALCFDLVGDVDYERLHCRAINGGREIPIPKQVRGYELIQTAISSDRVVADRWKHDHDPWWSQLLFWWLWSPIQESPSLPRRRVLFDLRSGHRMSSWKPRIQQSTSPTVLDWPYRCALSPSGEFLAEGGDGLLELYRLSP